MTITPNPIAKETPRPNGPAVLPKPTDEAAAPTSVRPDLTTLADDALAALVEQGQAEILRRKQNKENSFLALVAETARTLGLSPARVAAAIAQKSPRPRATSSTDGRSNVRPKYWCVSDHSQRWSGRGAAPKWFADYISSGGKEEDMRIPEGTE